MKKFVIVVIALAVIWAIPGVRNRIGTAALPLLERLGPVGERIADPFREVRARNEMKFFLRVLSNDQSESRPLPDERAFQQWIDRRMPQENGLDPWGNPYWLRRDGRSYTVGSNGPDGVRDTDDDVIQGITT